MRDPGGRFEAAPPEHGAPRLLVATADERFLTRVQALAAERGIEIAAARTRAEALAHAQAGGLDGALIGVGLGGPSVAFELARELRTRSVRNHFPLAFVADEDPILLRVAAAHAGASLFLAGPLDDRALDDALAQLVRAEGPRPRVLVVDDDPAFARLVARVLGEVGMQVRGTEEPARLVETLEDAQPDLLLLDADTPQIDGLELCQVVRAIPRWRELPILLVTARTDPASRVAAFQAGADDYLAKPIVEEELRARVQIRLERARLLVERAEHDAATGLPLRRPFLAALAVRLAEARRHGRPLTLVMLDLDGLKPINDRHGHLAGDHVLTALGVLLGRRFRQEDLRARWGGDEFLLAFPGEQPREVGQVLARTLAEFEAHTFTGDRGESFHASFSAGTACLGEDGVTIDELIAAADRRMYESKRTKHGPPR